MGLLGKDTLRPRHTAVCSAVLCCCPTNIPSSRAGSACSHTPGCARSPTTRAELTLWEAWWVVIDISDHDGDGGGAGQPAQLSRHVRGTDHHLVPVLCLTVQVSHSCPDHTWKWAVE